MNLPKVWNGWAVTGTASHSVVMPPDVSVEPFDRIFRVSTDVVTQSLTAQSWATDEVSRVFMDWAESKERDIGLLKSFAAWQKKKLDYQAIYNAYLLEAISEEEFEKESDAFVFDIKTPDTYVIGEAMDHLIDLLPFEVSTSEFADFFECEPREVLAAIKAVGHSPKLMALLPSGVDKEGE